MSVLQDSQTLSAKHQRMLYEESGISPDVAAARGYYTARKRSDVPECFPSYQRRLGLVIPGLTVEGERRYRLRPDRPRKDKRGKPQKYEQATGQPCHLDAASPRNLTRAKDRTVPLWVCEGEKKADALISAGECAISIPGVWNWQRDGEMLPDWQHIPLEGRDVYACYDSDTWRNPSVALALSRLIADLRERGAKVLTVVLEDAPDGEKIGADDALASGVTVDELKARARELAPEDVARERVDRNPALRDALATLVADWWGRDWHGRSAHLDRDVLWAILRGALAHGELVEGSEAVHVPISWGTIQLEAKISRRTLAKSLARLEDAGVIIGRIKPDNPDRSGVFVLSAKVDHYGVRERRERESNRGVTKVLPSSLPSRTPRLMNSSPGSRPRRGTVKGTRKVRQSPPPQRKPPQRRPGKVRGHLTDALEYAGGSLTLKEIAGELGVKARELTRRKRPGSKGRDGLLVWWIEAGIVTLDGILVSLTADWRKRLDEVREAGGEIEAERLAARRMADKRRGYRAHLSRKHRGERHGEATKPSRASVANVAASRAKRREHLERERERERERKRPAPKPVEADADLVEALRVNIHKFPLQPHKHRSTREYASWLASSLWAHELVEGQPLPAAVEVALAEIGMDRAA